MNNHDLLDVMLNRLDEKTREIARLTREREHWRTKYNNLRDSPFPPPVDDVSISAILKQSVDQT